MVRNVAKTEYFLSLVIALLVLAGAAVWSQATDAEEIAIACKAGRVSSPVFLKGMVVSPRCPAGKRG